MIDTSGFYKLDGWLMFAPNDVTGPDYYLSRDVPEDRTREVAGWKWFDSQAEAEAFYGVEPE